VIRKRLALSFTDKIKEERMMKKVYGMLATIVAGTVLSGCGPRAEVTLKVFNWGGYIYEKDSDIPGDKDLVDVFEDWYLEQYGVTVNVEYTTFATNEDFYTQVVQNRRYYDIFAPSDYMIQRLMKEGWLAPFDVDEDGTRPYLENYDAFVSPYLQSIYEDLNVTNVGPVSDYAAGYMWGTVGLAYNPEEINPEDVRSWGALYDPAYKNKATIKDSVREVLMAAMMHRYKDDFDAARAIYEALPSLVTAEAYNDFITTKINTINPQVLQEVTPSLQALVNNSLGLETDNAKSDIVSGKISMFMAWSGDATYAMDTLDEEGGVALEYVIPDEGSNIWFDGFVMHKDIAKNDADKEEDKQVKVVAQRFIDFLSQPEIAIQNMGYIGYTSFIAGDAVLESVIELNDAYNEGATEEDLVPLDLTYFFEGTLDDVSLDDALIYVLPNRQIMTQYPTPETIIRTALFNDFGQYNQTINELWFNVKASKS
jgi:spermidine/putrescine transport system substrate-binding protein